MHATRGESSRASADVAPAEVLARGVASAARLRSHPLIFASAHGARVVTTEGAELTDYMLGMGPMLLGHGRPEVLERVAAQLSQGVLFGTTRLELELAERLRDLLPHARRVAFVSSGSEGTHLATRIARASTGRQVIVKFEGHYHGWVDPLFVNTQNNIAAAPDVYPVPPLHAVPGQSVSPDLIVARWNDVDDIARIFDERGDDIAGVILEPLPMNFGSMLPDPGYTELLRELCSAHGALLIFDEVLSGFRSSLLGAAGVLGVSPDMAVYAKAIASGFPLAAVVGTDEAMASIVRGAVQPAGTYSGNPVSAVAALASLDILAADADELYPALERLGSRLRDGVRRVAAASGAPLEVNQIGSVIQLFWGTGPVRTFGDAARSDRERIARLSEGQEQRGSLLSPRGLILLSAAHRDADIDVLVDGIGDSLNTEE